MDEDWKNKSKEKELTDIKYFHSSLNNTKCSVDDYNYAKELYKYFSCEIFVITMIYMLRLMCFY